MSQMGQQIINGYLKLDEKLSFKSSFQNQCSVGDKMYNELGREKKTVT